MVKTRTMRHESSCGSEYVQFADIEGDEARREMIPDW